MLTEPIYFCHTKNYLVEETENRQFTESTACRILLTQRLLVFLCFDRQLLEVTFVAKLGDNEYTFGVLNSFV
jgi:hypothetical protein